MISDEFLTCSTKVPLLQSVFRCDPLTLIVRSQEQGSWDPNTLLAAISQASAVLVAIIGGFLVSRLVAISSEREGLRRLVDAAGGRIHLVSSDLDSARRTRLGRAERYFYEGVMEKLVNNPFLDLDELIKDRVIRGTTEDELRPYAVLLRKRVATAVEELKSKIKQADTRDLTFDELKTRGLAVDKEDIELYERVFEVYGKRLPQPSALSMITGGAGIGTLGLAVDYRPDWAHAADLRRQDEEIQAEAELMTQLKAAQAERDRLSDEMVRIGKPGGVAAAMWMLGLLSLGIVVPIGMMAFEPKGLDVLSKILLISSFIIGLVAILGYVAWFWRKIGADKS